MGGVCARCQEENARRIREAKRPPHPYVVAALENPRAEVLRQVRRAWRFWLLVGLITGFGAGWIAHDLAAWAAAPIAIWRAKEQGR